MQTAKIRSTRTIGSNRQNHTITTTRNILKAGTRQHVTILRRGRNIQQNTNTIPSLKRKLYAIPNDDRKTNKTPKHERKNKNRYSHGNPQNLAQCPYRTPISKDINLGNKQKERQDGPTNRRTNDFKNQHSQHI